MSLHLVGDVGGTHARLGLAHGEDGRFVVEPTTFRCAEFSSLDALLVRYVAALAPELVPSAWCIAVAGPVAHGVARLTNLDWLVSEAALHDAGLPRGVLVNDYEALAYAAPLTTAADVEPIGPVLPHRPRGTVAVLGAGTGFGAAAHCIDALGSSALVTEAGHIAFAPTDEVEVELLRQLTRRFGRVSVERILSGPGLANLHHAMGLAKGRDGALIGPAEVLVQAAAGDALALATVERFCRIYGAVAGDLALAFGATGGVLLAGGMAPRLKATLAGGGFRTAFEDKGRFAGYVSAVPTDLVVNPYLALVGAAARLRRSRSA